MIIFNTTFHIDDSIHDDCLLFLKNIYIPKATGNGFLSEPRLAFIHRQHEENGTSYSLQFKVENIETLNRWFSSEGQSLQKEMNSRFGEKALGFTTLLEEIEL